MVTFGFPEFQEGEPAAEEESTQSAPTGQPQPPRYNVGLGTGTGGGLVRSCLGSTGASMVDPPPLHRVTSTRVTPRKDLRAPSPQPPGNTISPSLNDGSEPQGMFLGLLLNDSSPVDQEDLVHVQGHRWVFKGAVELATRGKSYYFFIRCLLEMQQNVQLDEDGDALEPRLVRACKAFVKGQCRTGRMGDMYQLLTHFISNSVIFDQWYRFLVTAFAHQRANEEKFLVPHLELVWLRFCKFRAILENIFDVLNTNFVWRHRLPKIGDLVQDHMKRRCLSTDVVTRNELFTQGTAARNETVKQVKFAIGLG